MAELPHFPMISQRDGDANQNYDCVPASIAASLSWLTGEAHTARQVKDAVYGASYVGGTAARAYIAYCQAQGVTLAPMDGPGPQLVADLRAQIVLGHPCLITEPDPYAAGWTHVCAAYKDDGASITVMDPWIDQPVTKPYATWATQLRDNEIWTLEKIMVSLSDVSAYFTDLGNGVWKCSHNDMLLGHGMLAFWRSLTAPLALVGLPKTNEIAVPGHPGVVVQVFERVILTYDPAHVLDNPPGAGAVYAAHLDDTKSFAVSRLLNLLGISLSALSATALADLQALHASNTAGNAALAKVLADLGVTVTS